jgi:predicted small secreted protein
MKTDRTPVRHAALVCGDPAGFISRFWEVSMNRSLLGKLIAGCVLVVVGMSVSACNTTKGVGRDVERAGEAVQNAADDVRR